MEGVFGRPHRPYTLHCNPAHCSESRALRSWTLDAQNKRGTTTRRTTDEGVSFTPLAHVTDRWRDHIVDGGVIAPNMYQASAFDGQLS